MTDDQHQPAAGAPRLSEARERRLRMIADDADPAAPMPVLFAEVDRLRADLARTRAEAAALTRERDDAVTALNDQLAALQAAIDRAKDFPCPACGHHLTVACACEMQADLARSRAEAAALRAALEFYADPTSWDDGVDHGDSQDFGEFEHTPEVSEDQGERARLALAASHSEQPAAPVDRSAEAKVTDHFFVRRGGFEHCAYSWRVESERSYCERPYEEHAGSRPITTSPDHQAGDEP